MEDRIRQVLDTFFAEHPNVKVPVPTIAAYTATRIMGELPNLSLNTWESIVDKTIAYLRSHPDTFTITKGLHGGVTRNTVLISLPDQKVSTKREEHPCPRCGRMNDVGVSVCWNCECYL